MFEISANKNTATLMGEGISASGKTLFSGSDFVLTLNKYGKETFERIAAAEGVKKIGGMCIIEDALFEGKKVLVGICQDSSDYHSEFVIPEKYEFKLK